MQRIFSEGLSTALSKGLQPFYLLTGQDLLLIGEAKDQIVQAGRLHDFDEKQEFTIANDTQWDMLFDLVQSNGLFFNRQILVLNLPENLTVAQQKQLAELLAFSHSDLIFILHQPKLTKTMEKQGWFIQLNNALLINCQTPDISKLPIWLQHRAKAMELQLDPEAIQLFCYSYEGNLLALKQALQMLQLRYPEQKIGLNRAKEVIEQSAQFTPFQWIDALLEGKFTRASRVLHHLQNEEVQPVVLLRIVQKELLLLLEMTRCPQPVLNSHQSLYNGNLRAEFDRLKVWQNRRNLYQTAVSRLTYNKLYKLIQSLAELEKQVKQEFSDDSWQAFERFGTLFK
ncbi:MULTISPECIES: DNA polymerase III subunit delta [Glaesserella]|uniref:DNA polymerase III subunit delta n=1 Tax=Glaesserella australis TaxID=2094024 RepID=A0A328BYY0_9PAST|nr:MULTISPECIES: DNA polymerase III subunit delta [Glaesserella]AUI67141.1 DNA polymerase III subunit delta [Glaesserella sp. 15-184]RAL18657.1 DNA polymerase III subunit delta [Glaesserella australis]